MQGVPVTVVSAAIVVAGALLACGRNRTASLITSPEVSTRAIPSPPPTGRSDSFQLLRSSRRLPAPPRAGVQLTIAPTELVIEDARIPAPSTAEETLAYTEKTTTWDEFVIPQLASVLNRLPHSSDAIISVDTRVTYGIVMRVLYTLGRSEIRRMHFLATGDPRRGAAVGILHTDFSFLSSPPLMTPEVDAKPPLTIYVNGQGIDIIAGGIKLARGCVDREGTYPTVAKQNHGHDLDAVVRCGQRLKAAGRVSDAVALYADPQTDFQSIGSVIDALTPTSSRIALETMR